MGYLTHGHAAEGRGHLHWSLGDANNAHKREAKLPSHDETPILYPNVDGWSTNDGFTIERMSRGVVSVLALL